METSPPHGPRRASHCGDGLAPCFRRRVPLSTAVWFLCRTVKAHRPAATPPEAVQKVQRRSVSRSQKTVLSSPLKPCLPAPILCGCRSGGCPWSFPLRGFRRKGTAYVGATGLGNCVQRGSSRGSLQKRLSEARVSTATPRAESVKRHHTPGCEGVRA